MFAGGYQTVALLSLLLYSLVLIRISMDVTSPKGVFELDEKGLQPPNRITIEQFHIKSQSREPKKDNSKPPPRRPRETKRTEKTTSELPKKKKVSLSELAARVGSHVHVDDEEPPEKEETYREEETPQKNIRGADETAADSLSTGQDDEENENDENDVEDTQVSSHTSETAVDNESAAAETENEHALKGDDDMEEEDEVGDDADKEAEAAKRTVSSDSEQQSNEGEGAEVEEEQQENVEKTEEETEQDEQMERKEDEEETKPQKVEEEPDEIVHDAYKSQTDSAKKTRPTHWRKFFDSSLCRKFRSLSPGHKADKNMGQGVRSLCHREPSEKKTVEYRTEIGGSIDISFQYKAIYIPVMKAGSQMFQEVFRKRLKGKRIYDRELHYYLKKYELRLEDFYIFTFVRNPFSTFVSAYGEVSKYTARNRTQVKGFSAIEDRPENEPKRALAALEDIRKGTFHGLVPAHMYTQTWKVSRCMADRALTEIPLNFVGHLENLDADWKYVERQLKLSHQNLPVIHSSGPKRQLPFDAPSKSSRFSTLTREVCDYYQVDFVCFGYDDSICNQ